MRGNVAWFVGRKKERGKREASFAPAVAVKEYLSGRRLGTLKHRQEAGDHFI
jgi:hypothetical protein